MYILGGEGIREIDFATLSYTPGNFLWVSQDIKKNYVYVSMECIFWIATMTA